MQLRSCRAGQPRRGRGSGSLRTAPQMVRASGLASPPALELLGGVSTPRSVLARPLPGRGRRRMHPRHRPHAAAASMTPLLIGSAAVAAASAAYLAMKHSSSRQTSEITIGKGLEFHQTVLSRCPTITSRYKSYPFVTLFGGHLETIFAARARRDPSPDVTYSRKQLDMPDGGTVALDSATLSQVRHAMLLLE